MAEQVIAITGSLTMATAGQAYRDIEKNWLSQMFLLIFLASSRSIRVQLRSW
jgi:hypothetical protein